MVPKNKRISVLHPYVHRKGGAVKMMIYLSNLLKENNNVVLYTFSYDKTLFSQECSVVVKSFNFIKMAYEIRKSDYIIIGNSPMQFVGVISKIFFFSNAKLIWWHHHYPWYYNENTNVFIWIKRLLEKLTLNFIDVVVSNSQYISTSIEDIFHIKSKILYPVMNKEFYNYNKNVSRDSNLIFTYGRWVEGKNIEQVFQTYEDIKGKVSDLKLHIGGEGDKLSYYVEKYKNDANVSFLGGLNTSEIIKNLEISRVFLFPSKIDSFGMTLIEAMSIGVPAVAFNMNGAREIIQNDKNGYLVDTDSEFTNKVLEILNDSLAYKRLSKECLSITDRFSHSNFVRQLEKIFLP